MASDDELAVAEVLTSAFRILRRDFARLFAIQLAIYLPLFVVFALLLTWTFATPTRVDGGLPPSLLGPGLLVVMLGFGLVTVIASGAVFQAVFQRMRGVEFSLGAVLATGLRRAPAVLLVGLAISVLAFLGAFVFLVGAVVVLTWTAVAVPVAVVERPGAWGLGAIPRSLDLTRGYRWEVFAIFLLVALIGQAVGFALQFGLLLPAAVHPALGLVGLLVGLVGIATVQLYGLITQAVAYHHLRRVKEGIDAAQITAVFE